MNTIAKLRAKANATTGWERLAFRKKANKMEKMSWEVFGERASIVLSHLWLLWVFTVIPHGRLLVNSLCRGRHGKREKRRG